MNEPKSAATVEREQIIRNVQERMSRASRGFGWPELGATLTSGELRCAAEAAVEELVQYLPRRCK